MRLAIEINVTGSTIDEITTKALAEWNRFSESTHSALPSGSEIDITHVAENQTQYNARVLIRTKVENNE